MRDNEDVDKLKANNKITDNTKADNHRYVEEFNDYLTNERNLSENTVYNYINDIEHFLSSTDKEINRISETDILSYISKSQTKGYKNATLNRKLSSLKTFFIFLLNLGYINSSPAISISLKRESRKSPDALAYEEVEKLLSAPDIESEFGIRDKAILELMYGSGLKIGEIVNLNTDDIDMENEYIRCKKGSNSERFVPMNEHSIKSLKYYLDYSRYILLDDSKSNALFLNRFGNRISRQSIWKSIKEYGIKAGIEKNIDASMLRHSFAIHMLKNGLKMDQVKEILGHVDISTTQIYREQIEDETVSSFKKVHLRK